MYIKKAAVVTTTDTTMIMKAVVVVAKAILTITSMKKSMYVAVKATVLSNFLEQGSDRYA
jgi:hypothetical protein